MKILKNTILIAILLLFSSKLAKCQWSGYEGEVAITMLSEEAIVVEPTEEVVSVESGETTVTTTEETVVTTEETRTTEETAMTEDPSSGWSEETTTTKVTYEETVNSEDPFEEDEAEEVEVIEEEEAVGACPQYIEETEVDGYWMTFHPCCVSSNAVCDNTYEPVCIEKARCEDEHCRWHYETVDNVCNACKGHGNRQYSKGRCPWESGDNRLRYRQRRYHH